MSSTSLRTKLLVFAAVLVLVPGVLLTVIAARSGRASLERVIGRQLSREAAHTAERLSAVLRAERQTVAGFARQDLMREVRVGDVDKRVAMALTTLRDGSALRRDYLVLDAAHRVVAASDPALLGPAPAWTAGLVGAPVPARLVDAPGVGETRLAMTAAIHDPDDPGRRLGTLVGLLDWQRVMAVAGDVREELGARGFTVDVLLCRADGTVIGGARGEGGAGPETVAALARDTWSERPGYAVDASGGWMAGRAALAPDLPDWRLLVVESRSQALAPARQLGQRLTLLMGLALVAALALATGAARRVVRPLTELTHAIRGLARGDDPAGRVPVRSGDEVGELAGAFNQMAGDLDRAQKELVEAEKFAFVGELASGVAHEIRTSLGVLRSSAQMLERSLPDTADDATGELASMIGAEVQRLSGVVDDLLTLDRPHPPRLEPAHLSEPVLRAADFVAPQAQERGVRIVRTPVADEPLVSCEPELVQKVALNLLVNAVEALPDGGRVEVRILGARDGHGGFEVRDDGEGIPEALRQRIFQPFVTARHGGVGLGLTFVKRVVHEHRGRVSVESGPGRGTCFRVEIPLSGDPR